MSYLAIRTFTTVADVFAFKTEREATRWVEMIRAFWAVAIKRKQVRIEYIGKYGLPPGYYPSNPRGDSHLPGYPERKKEGTKHAQEEDAINQHPAQTEADS